MNIDIHPAGFAAELRLIATRARQAWGLVPSRDKWALGVAASLMGGTSICSTAVPIFLGRLVDEVKTGAEQGSDNITLFRLAVFFLGLIGATYLVREAIHLVRRNLVENTCTRINRDTSVNLLSHLLKVDLRRLAHTKVGALQGRIFRAVDGLMRFLRMGFLDFLPALFTGAFALVAALSKQPVLGLIMAGVVPMAVFLTFRQLISQKGVRLELMRACEEIDGMVTEQLSSIEYIRAADTDALEAERIARAAEARRATEVRHHFKMSLFGCAKAINEGFFHILLLGVAVYCAILGTISFGAVLTFSMLYLNVMTPLSEIHRVLDEGHEASLRVGDLLHMLALPIDPSFAPVSHEEPRLRPGTPAVLVENLHAAYLTHDGQDQRALHGVDLAIHYGETIGIAGCSGCGKSTCLKVLLRLTPPSGGSIRVGGIPLDKISRSDLGRLVGYVGQSPFVFAGTIAENIAYGNEGVTLEAVRHAAHLANLHDEIMLMPGGYDAVVTERGQNLSGGQRQRLAIARILLKQPAILILDEATSALDNISERKVQRSLGLTCSDRTTILVAHRLSTLRDADRIFVFSQGRIEEVGAYDELLHRGGAFTELVKSAEKGVSTQ